MPDRDALHAAPGQPAGSASRRGCLLWLAGLPVLGAGCAQRRSPEALASARGAASSLLADPHFTAPDTLPDRDAVLRPSEAMREFAERQLRRSRERDPRQALLQALFHNGALQLSYDAGRTRDAAGTFAERSGNCLSLVLMTASFARMLELPVSFQAVVVDEAATRAGDYLFLSGHVNLILGTRAIYRRLEDNAHLIVDFLPSEQVAGYRTQPLEEIQVLSMYMNNRAAEALAVGDTTSAYWWAREALNIDPAASGAINTLGVVYSRAGLADRAESAWRQALALDPDSTSVLANLVQHLEQRGRSGEAAPLASRLALLQPVPPLHSYRLGRAAFDRGEYALARDHFARELRRQPYQAEVHYWLAVAHAKLGQAELAQRDLARAVTHSTSPGQQQLYAGKLARLRELGHRTN